MGEDSLPGERKIIDLIVRRLHKMPRMPIPFGDDVSGMDIGAGRLAILKCDMLVRRTDIPRGMSLRQAARKAVVMNISDLASKGVQPHAGLYDFPRSILGVLLLTADNGFLESLDSCVRTQSLLQLLAARLAQAV